MENQNFKGLDPQAPQGKVPATWMKDREHIWGPGRTIACQPAGQLEDSGSGMSPRGEKRGSPPQDILVGGNFVVFSLRAHGRSEN